MTGFVMLTGRIFGLAFLWSFIQFYFVHLKHNNFCIILLAYLVKVTKWFRYGYDRCFHLITLVLPLYPSKRVLVGHPIFGSFSLSQIDLLNISFELFMLISSCAVFTCFLHCGD